jgi:hypothetical protein
MNLTNLNFAQSARRFNGASPLAVGAFALALAWLGSLVWQTSALDVEQQRAQTRMEQARQALERRRTDALVRDQTRQAALVKDAPSPAMVSAINGAIGQLNLPWPQLFGALEAVKPKSIAILQLEPDVQRNVLKLVAEAKTLDEATEFVGLMQQHALFAQVNLVKHELYDKDPNRPYRFQIEAVWRKGL